MIIKITVKPNAKKTEILEQNKDEYKIAIAAPPEKGLANKELIKFLKKKFSKEVEIIRGKTSRRKIIKIN